MGANLHDYKRAAQPVERCLACEADNARSAQTNACPNRGAKYWNQLSPAVAGCVCEP